MSRQETVSVGHIELKNTEFSAEINYSALPVLPTRNLVLFPGVIFPIHLVRPSSRRLAEYAERTNAAIAIVCQKDPSVDNPRFDDLYRLGVVGQVMKIIPIPDGNAVAMVMCHSEKIRLEAQAEASVADSITVVATTVHEAKPRMTQDFKARLEYAGKLMSEANEFSPIQEAFPAHGNNKGKGPSESAIVNSMCVTAPIGITDRYNLLTYDSIRERVDELIALLIAKKDEEQVRAEIEEGARQRMGQRQRNAILETQMEAIRAELYGEGSEIDLFREQLDVCPMPTKAKETMAREINKLEHLNPTSPDFQTQYAYIQTVLDLPWGIKSEGNEDFAFAENELNETHSGLEKVKERVLEQVAMLMHSPQSHAPILCLVGPPGVGKTSLGQSIARALGREFQRVSLGGMHDESEIRGHRRTYIAAMPGRIIDAVRRSGVMNPVIMLDEIDKLGQDYKGNPSAALLEVLDPEQNVKFHDNYIDLDFDLSEVLFITTANTLSTIDSPLLDRMEVINLSGYSAEEKLEIAREHLLPTLRKEMGLQPDEAPVSDAAIAYIIDNYTAESGVRQLQKKLASVLRKYIRAKIAGKEFALPVEPTALRELLGIETNNHDKYSTDRIPGVATGLAWTAVGGEILFIEAVTTAGKGDGALTLTGNLGDVMKESAAIAHRFVKAHAAEFGIDPERIKSDIHIHVPEGAIPKDGPSAGITMVTAIVSALTGRPVRERLAMTGETTLRGKVLPVGGIKEKVLAAKRAGITEIIISEENRRNVEDVKPEYLTGIRFNYVNSVADVLRLALE
ncbi:MAG: endopeptidase La [Muribaculaceae bacterium]|nr:endopeptidase La [Muribaculaceae bacterium]